MDISDDPTPATPIPRVVPKWGSFDGLNKARARARRTDRAAPPGASSSG